MRHLRLSGGKSEMPDKHALLSASSSHRWIACPPSALLCAKTKQKSSPYAQQGTDAHSLCEHKVLTALGQASQRSHDSLFTSMRKWKTVRINTVLMSWNSYWKQKNLCGDPQVLVEQRLDFSDGSPKLSVPATA